MLRRQPVLYRYLANLKSIDPLKIFRRTFDYKIYNGEYEVPVRIYLPKEELSEGLPVLLFFHGGGWVTNFFTDGNGDASV